MEYLTFQKLVTPIIIQVLFWIAIVFIVVAAIVAFAQGSIGGGLGILIFGPIIARVYAELLIVIFNIEREVKRIAGPPATPALISPTTPAPSGPTPYPSGPSSSPSAT